MVVLVHGYGASSYHWRYNVPALAEAGYQVRLAAAGRVFAWFLLNCRIVRATECAGDEWRRVLESQAVYWARVHLSVQDLKYSPKSTKHARKWLSLPRE